MTGSSRRRLAGAVVGLVVAVGLVAPSMAGAAEVGTAGEVTVPIGGTITVTGDGCVLGPGRHPNLRVVFAQTDYEFAFGGGSSAIGPDGKWSTTLDVLDRWLTSDGRLVPAAPGSYGVRATCRDLLPEEGSAVIEVDSDIKVVHVIAKATTTTTEPPTTVAGAAPTTKPAAPAKPAPVKAKPAFTG